MTNKEAQNLIERNRSVFQYDPEMLESLDLAIKALDTIERLKDMRELRLIDADALKEKFNEGAYTSKGVREVIDNAPTIESEPSCVLQEFGKCSYKETGCSDCKIKSDLRYMCHSSSWKELQALREFKEKHEKKGKWVFKHNSADIWCSECDENFPNKIPQDYDYCPKCGARME